MLPFFSITSNFLTLYSFHFFLAGFHYQESRFLVDKEAQKDPRESWETLKGGIEES
jgi:hypothetical protein